jgi:hypothetical protein
MSDRRPPLGRYLPAAGACSDVSLRAALPAAAAVDLLHLLDVDDRGDANKLLSFTLLHAPSTVSLLPLLSASRYMTRQRTAAASTATQGASILPSSSTPLHTGGGNSFFLQGGDVEGVEGVGSSPSTRANTRGGRVSPSGSTLKGTGVAQQCIFINDTNVKTLCLGRIGSS